MGARKPAGPVHHGHNSEFNRKTACGRNTAGARFISGWRGITCDECQRRSPHVPAEFRLPDYQVALCCDPQR